MLSNAKRVMVISSLLMSIAFSIGQSPAAAAAAAAATSSYRIVIAGDSTVDPVKVSGIDGITAVCQSLDDVVSGSCADLNKVKVTATKYGGADDINCSNTYLEASDCSLDDIELCYNLNTSHWYGGTTVRVMQWPVENLRMPSVPYVTGDAYDPIPEYGGVQERYWFNSDGLAIFVDWESPLWLSINNNGNGLLCLRGRYKDSLYVNDDYSLPSLNFTQCQGRDVRHVHDYMAATFLPRPDKIPDERMFRDPIWSTWAQYKADVDQTKVLEFADLIQSNGFNCSQLEVDDRWETHYGDMQFDPVKFPDPRGMVESLRSRGLRTTLWVHPFLNLDSSALSDFLDNRAYVGDSARNRLNQRPGVTRWWQGQYSMTIDFTDPSSAAWFKDRLTALQLTYGINSFKFDAGETNWLPNCFRLARPQPLTVNPSYYTTAYVEMAYSVDSQMRLQEVRVGARTQHVPVFVRMMDKDSRWTYNNGLATLIPHALTFGLIGYPFVLPDMVGGNAYGVLPDRELFIRWTQVNVFLPSIQFSIAPWQYDAELVQIVNDMMALRARYVDLILDLARESTVTGAPINRPLWWIAPTDPVALTIDSEFLLGDDLLVAPILEQGATARDIYLPAGTWHDQLRDVEVSGGQWLNGYSVQLNELAYFIRVGSGTRTQSVHE